MCEFKQCETIALHQWCIMRNLEKYELCWYNSLCVPRDCSRMFSLR